MYIKLFKLFNTNFNSNIVDGLFQCSFSKKKFSLSIINIETCLLELKLILKKKFSYTLEARIYYIKSFVV